MKTFCHKERRRSKIGLRNLYKHEVFHAKKKGF